jgi:hypothetical protein
LITSLVSFGHCIVSPSLIYASGLPLWYLLAIVLSVLTKIYQRGNPEGTNQRRTDNTMTKRYQSGNPEAVNQRRANNTMTKRYQRGNQEGTNQRRTLYCQYFFDLYLLDFPFGIFWSLYCSPFFDLRLLNYPFGIFWSKG